MEPALLAEFCEEYTSHLNRLRREKNAALDAAKAEITRLARQRENIVQAIKDGVPAAELKDDLARITARREVLEGLLAGAKEEPVLLHPGMAEQYRKQVAQLVRVLTAEENRAEAADILRSLIDRIELTSNSEGELDVDLHGDLAGILSLAAGKDEAHNKKGRPDVRTADLVQQVKMVAGVGFEPTTFRL